MVDFSFLFILLFGLLVIAVPFIFILILVKIIASGSKGGGNRMTGEETRAMQEIHRGLERMAKRVEALETIILEQSQRTSEYHEALDREE